MAYHGRQAESGDLALAGRAEGGGEEAKHKNGLPGAQLSPRATPSNTPKESGPMPRPGLGTLVGGFSLGW
jgi:hypothetical protein